MSKTLKISHSMLFPIFVGAAMLLGFCANAQTHMVINVGSQTQTSREAPTNTYYNYSVSQSIYTAAEIGIDGMIDTLYYYIPSGPIANRNITIYMGEADKNTFANNYDYVPQSSLQQVYHGILTINQGWVTIPLSNPFNYQCHNSLIISVLDSTGNYISNTPEFAQAATTGLTTRTAYSDYYARSIDGLGQSGYSQSYHPILKLGITSNGNPCAMPSDLTLNMVSGDSASVSWSAASAATFDVVISDSIVNDLDAVTPLTTTDYGYTFHNLSSNTLYYVYIRSHCINGGTSAWTVPLTFYSACHQFVGIPYTEGFENCTDGQLPNCWVNADSTTTTVNNGYTAHMSNVALNFFDFNATTSLLVLPPMNSISNLQLQMYVSQQNNSTHTLEAGVLEDTGFVPLKTVNFSASGQTSEYVPATIYFNRYTGNGHNIALRATATGYYNFYLDDIVVSNLPSCLPVSELTYDSLASDAFFLSWEVNGDENAWDIFYDTVPMNTGSYGNLIHSQSNRTWIWNLDAATLYYVYVRANCGNDQSEWFGPIEVRTEIYCGDRRLTLSEVSSQSASNSSLLPVASAYGSSYSQSIYHQEDLRSQGIFEGYIHNIAINWSQSSYDYPKHLSIYLANTDSSRFNGNSSWLSPDEFTLVYADSNNTHTPGWVTYQFRQPFHYEGSNICVAFLSNHNGTNATTNISGNASRVINSGYTASIYKRADNVIYTPESVTSINATGTTSALPFLRLQACVTLPECPDPDSITIANIGPDNVTFRWSQEGQPFAWEISYDTIQMEDPLSGTYFMVYDSTAFIDQLTPNTSYYFYIHALCGATESQWVGPILVTPNTWSMRPNRTDTIAMCGGTIYDDGGSHGTYSDRQNSTLVLYPTDTAFNVMLSGTLSAEGSSYDYIKIYDGVGTNDSTRLLYSSFGLSSSLQNIQVVSTNGPLTIFFHSDFSGHMSGYALNVTCIDRGCTEVSNLNATNVSPTSITLDWTPTASESIWYLKYADHPFNFADSTITDSIIYSHPCTIQGLTPNKHYYFGIAAGCPLGMSAAAMIDLRTACPTSTAIPYYEDFEDFDNAEVPSCWITPSTSENLFGHTLCPSVYSTINTHSGSRCLRFEADSALVEIAALPEMDNISSLQISFYAAGDNAYPPFLHVGILESDGTFVPIDSIPVIAPHQATYTYHRFTTYFYNYTGNGRRIAFRTRQRSITNSYSLYIDDIAVEYAPTCVAPSRFVSTGNTTTSVDLAWSGSSNNDSWELAMDTADFTPTAGIIVNNPYYTVQNLVEGQSYYFYVRKLCGLSDTSIWVGPIHAVPGSWIMRYQQTDTITMCGGTIYDNGHNADYRANASDILVVHPSGPDMAVAINGVIHAENNYDNLYVYDGEGINGALLGHFSGNDSIHVTASQGPMTLHFSSDASTQYSGYELHVNCISTITCPAPIIDTVIVGATQAQLVWTGSASAYEVAIRTDQETEWSDSSTTSTTSHLFVELLPSTNYVARIRAICSTTDQSYYRYKAFTTDSLACIIPTQLTTTQIGLDYATFSWQSADPVANTFELHVFNATEDYIQVVTGTSATISNLFDSTLYHAAVRAICSPVTYSQWSDTIDLRTAICIPVSGVTITNVTGTSAQVTWTPQGSETSWEIEYGGLDFPQGAGTRITVAEPRYTLSGLETESMYDIYVRAICTDVISSDWSTKTSFTTTTTGIAAADLITISIRPNPAADHFTVRLQGIDSEAEVTILDITGRVVRHTHTNTQEAHFSGLSSGSYFVRITADGAHSTSKLIVK